MTTKNPNYRALDLQGSDLDSFTRDDIQGAYGTLIRNAKVDSIEDFERFALKFGKPLMYDDSPRWVFDYVQNEAELHQDGISAESAEKFPEFLFFYVEECPKAEVFGGEFILMDCVKALDVLPKDMVDYLRNHKQEFYGYPLYNKPRPKPDEFSFSIDTITSYGDTERLRFHLPFDRIEIRNYDTPMVYSIPHDFALLIEGLNAQESFDMMREMYDLLMTDELIWELNFEKNDILIVDNERAFHGRRRTSERLPRLVHRIQTLHG